MAKTEATVTSGVKNWYINFFIGIVGPCGMPIGDKNVIFFFEIQIFGIQGFPGPSKWTSLHPPGSDFMWRLLICSAAQKSHFTA